MKIRLKGRLISTKRASKEKLERIIKICKEVQKTYIQTKAKKQWTNFVISMLENKLNKKVGSDSYETAIKSH